MPIYLYVFNSVIKGLSWNNTTYKNYTQIHQDCYADFSFSSAACNTEMKNKYLADKHCFNFKS